MPRPRGDGTPAAPANRRKLTDRYVRSIVPDLSRAVAPYWDTVVPALWLAVYPSGKKTWRVCYRRNALGDGFALGDARSISVASARRIAARVAVEAAEGKDPKAERRAARLAGTFSELYDRYVSEWSRRRNKSWEQSDAIAQRGIKTPRPPRSDRVAVRGRRGPRRRVGGLHLRRRDGGDPVQPGERDRAQPAAVARAGAVGRRTPNVVARPRRRVPAGPPDRRQAG